MFSATMKSSMLMGSEVEMACSEFFRNWAMPLGVLCVGAPSLQRQRDELTLHGCQQAAWRGPMPRQKARVPVGLLCLVALLSQTDSHHAPCDVLHAFLVGQVLLCLRKEAPDLCRQRVFLGHLLWAGAHTRQPVIEAVQRLHLGQSTLRDADLVGKIEAKLLQGVARAGLLPDAAVLLGLENGGGASVLATAESAAF